MASRELSIDEIVAILPISLPRIRDLTSGLSPAQIHQPPEPNAWSINDVLAHLRACQDVLGGNILRIVSEDNPSWRAINPRTHMARTDYPSWHFERALDAFDSQRAAFLEKVLALPDTAWDRTATVTVPPNKTYEYSARYYGSWLASHERIHVRQIAAIAEEVA